jgi:hypothetical protein
MILSTDSHDSEDLNDQNFLEIYQSAMELWGLIHARFILTPNDERITYVILAPKLHQNYLKILRWIKNWTNWKTSCPLCHEGSEKKEKGSMTSRRLLMGTSRWYRQRFWQSQYRLWHLKSKFILPLLAKVLQTVLELGEPRMTDNFKP